MKQASNRPMLRNQSIEASARRSSKENVMKVSSIRVALAGATLGFAALTASPSAVKAQTIDSPGVIYACYVPGTGVIYRRNGDVNCNAATHIKLSWGTVGPNGSTGTTGATGATG